ncbi:MAG: LamG domain-containing protein, partial [Kiritimatiellota bacterium]|nr:LamG domain-containing protein [Kiritimatiellota bacterium]
DRSASGAFSFVRRNYTRDNTFRGGGFNILGFSGIAYDGDDDPPPYRWAARSEGFDTDNDLISDFNELTGYRTNGVVAGTDPLNDESPLLNRVLWLDGTNSWLCSSKWHTFGNFTRFSIEAWVRPARLSSTNDQVVVEKTSSYLVQDPNGVLPSRTVALANFQLGLNTAGMPYVLFHGLTGYTTNRAAAARVGLLQVGTWTHLAGVFNGTNLTLFVNGEVSATHRTTDVPASGNEEVVSYWWPSCNLSIGARQMTGGRVGGLPGTATNFFAGCVDEVRVWDRVLTVGEIKARKNRRLATDEVGTILPGNDPNLEGTNNLFAYYRFTDLPDPKVNGTAPSGFPTNRPPLAVNYSAVYTNYLVMASDRVKRIPRLPPLDTRVIGGAPVVTNGLPDGYGISTADYMGIQLPAGFRNSANPYNFTSDPRNMEMLCSMWLLGNAQGLRTNTWLSTLDPNNPDSTDTDGDGL